MPFREAEKLDEEMSVDYGHLKLKTEYWCCGDVTVSDKGGEVLVRILYLFLVCEVKTPRTLTGLGGGLLLFCACLVPPASY